LLGGLEEFGELLGVEIASTLGDFDVLEGDGYVAEVFGVEVGFELVALMTMMQGLNGLLEADGDEQADADGGDVDEEVAPGVGGVVGWVDVEHRVGSPEKVWGRLLAGRLLELIFVDHVVEHLVDRAGTVEDAAAGTAFIELEGDDRVVLTGEVGEYLKEGISFEEGKEFELRGGEPLQTPPRADADNPRAQEVALAEGELIGFVVETGVDLGFVFGEKADGAAGFGDGPDGL